MSLNHANEAFLQHQSTKNALLHEFKQASSNEKSFLRRATTLSLLDALCHLTGRMANDLFSTPTVDFLELIKTHRQHPLVCTYFLYCGFTTSGEPLTEPELEYLVWGLNELGKAIRGLATKQTPA